MLTIVLFNLVTALIALFLVLWLKDLLQPAALLQDLAKAGRSSYFALKHS